MNILQRKVMNKRTVKLIVIAITGGVLVFFLAERFLHTYHPIGRYVSTTLGTSILAAASIIFGSWVGAGIGIFGILLVQMSYGLSSFPMNVIGGLFAYTIGKINEARLREPNDKAIGTNGAWLFCSSAVLFFHCSMVLSIWNLLKFRLPLGLIFARVQDIFFPLIQTSLVVGATSTLLVLTVQKLFNANLPVFDKERLGLSE